MADIASLIVEVKGEGIKQTTDRLQKLAQEANKTSGSNDKLKKETDKLIAALVLESKAAGKTADEIRLLKLEQKGATAAQIQAAKAAMNYRNAQKQMGDQSKVVQGNFKAMRGSTQQVSYQLQDIAVQAQMGTNAFVILGQQGPQLASVFGPGGAVAGAVISFAALLGGVMFAGLKDTSETMEEVEQRAMDLAAKLNELIKEDKKVVLRQLTSQLEKSKEALEAQELVITRAKVALDTYATQVESFFVSGRI